jgi:beclin 1
LEKTEADLIDQVNQKQEEKDRIAKEDEVFYRHLRDNHRYVLLKLSLETLLIFRTLAEQTQERHDLNAQIKYATEHRKQLLATNVLDMAFFIWKDGEYGTINGLRLGRLPNDNVEWNEINGAFGQIAMLLVVSI